MAIITTTPGIWGGWEKGPPLEAPRGTLLCSGPVGSDIGLPCPEAAVGLACRGNARSFQGRWARWGAHGGPGLALGQVSWLWRVLWGWGPRTAWTRGDWGLVETWWDSYREAWGAEVTLGRPGEEFGGLPWLSRS